MSLRETSWRRIKEVLRRPEIEEPLGLADCALVPMGEEWHYLKCGAGLAIYRVQGELAHLHGALTPGDGHEVGRLWPAHLEYLRALGVRRITTRHRADHRRASGMCRALGFTPTACDLGFKRYERSI